MIPKNNRVYIRDWFEENQKFESGDIVQFEMPPFCSGEYKAIIYIDNDGNPYIEKSKSYYIKCRDYFLVKKAK
jgi:hypothetical protein